MQVGIKTTYLMKDYDNVIDDNFTENGLQITGVAVQYLETSAKWARFLAIVGFVMIGFMVLGAIGMGAMMSNPMMEEMPFPIGGIMFLYVAMAALYFFPTLYLYRFATQALKAVKTENSMDLTESLLNMRNCYRFVGIMTVIVIGLYVLLLIGLAGFGMTA